MIQLCKDNNITEALATYTKHPDCFGASTLIAAVAWKHSKDLDLAFSVYDKLKNCGVSPDATVYGVLFRACQICSKPNKMFPLWNDMQSYKLPTHVGVHICDKFISFLLTLVCRHFYCSVFTVF